MGLVPWVAIRIAHDLKLAVAHSDGVLHGSSSLVGGVVQQLPVSPERR